jgi:tetratricopeptide (TPR) repeat protein
MPLPIPLLLKMSEPIKNSPLRKVCRKSFHIILLLFFILFSKGTAQWITSPDFDEHTRKGIDHVYNLEFSQADSDFQYLTRTYPDHPAGYFFRAMIDWWKMLLDLDNTSLDDDFVNKLDVVIDKCDKILDKKPDDITALFFKGGALGFRGRLRANRGNWIRAANDGRLALPIVQKAYKIAPDNYDILLGIGIYHYYAEVIPEEYPIVKPLMLVFPSGNRKKGIEELTEASLHAKYAAVEASYFLMQLYYTFEHQYDKALGIALRLFAKFPKNVLFQRYIGRCYVSLNNADSTLAIFQDILARCNASHPLNGYGSSARREALYYLGVYTMMKGNYDKALQYFYGCDKESRTLDTDGASGFMAMANLKVGMIYDLQKKREYAVQQYRKVLEMKNFGTTHDQAEQYLESPYMQ